MTPRSPEVRPDRAYYWGLEVLPEFQNVPTSYDDSTSIGGNLSYSTAMGTIGGIEAEKGFMTRLVTQRHRRAGRLLHPDVTWRPPTASSPPSTTRPCGSGWPAVLAPAPRRALRQLLLRGIREQLGGPRTLNRYRRLTSFPGLEINEVGGRNFGKGSVEWTLPPLRFKKLGITNFYATWARLAFFGQGVVTNPENDEWRREVVNVGAQLNMKLILFFSLESTLSAGYARAFEDGYQPSDELMVSLKILR